MIVQEAAYNLMLLFQRRQLHRSVAEWYERSSGGDLAVLAYRRLAEVPAKAVHYLEQAGTPRPPGGRLRRGRPVLIALLEVDDADRGGLPAGGQGMPDAATIRLGPLGAPARRRLPRPRPVRLEQEHLHAALALLAPDPGQRPPVSASWPGRPASSCATGLAKALVARSADACAALEEAAEVYDRLFLVDYHASQRALYQAVKGLNLAEAAVACRGPAGLRLLGRGRPAGRHRVAEGFRATPWPPSEGAGDPSARAVVLQSAAPYKLGVGRWAEVRQHVEDATAIVRRPRGTRAGWPSSPAWPSGSGTSRPTWRPCGRC